MQNPNKVGLVGAVLFAGFHLVWSLLVLLNWAQPFYDFVLWAHMIHLQITIGPFDPMAFVSLMVLTLVVGYIAGNAGARVWNRFHRA